jgi:hypothetical protein
MVDRVIKKKKWSTKRLLTIGGITALVLLAFGSYYFTSGKSRLNVDLDRITIATGCAFKYSVNVAHKRHLQILRKGST